MCVEHDQEAYGGVLHVDEGAYATFMVPVAFEGNSVTAGFSGGAVYAGGNVRDAVECRVFQRESPFRKRT